MEYKKIGIYKKLKKCILRKIGNAKIDRTKIIPMHALFNNLHKNTIEEIILIHNISILNKSRKLFNLSI